MLQLITETRKLSSVSITLFCPKQITNIQLHGLKTEQVRLKLAWRRCYSFLNITVFFFNTKTI